MIQCTCLHCGKPFSCYQSLIDIGKGKYCSQTCSGLATAIAKGRNSDSNCTCLQCGKGFHASPRRLKKGEGKYCSNACKFIARFGEIGIRNQTYFCQHCGKEYVPGSRSMKKYCSRKCYGLANRGANSPHWAGGKIDEYGSGWSTQRNLVIARDGGKCQICNRKPHKGERNFHVHHIVKLRDFNGDHLAANKLTNLITLCPLCHKRADRGFIPVPMRLL